MRLMTKVVIGDPIAGTFTLIVWPIWQPGMRVLELHVVHGMAELRICACARS